MAIVRWTPARELMRMSDQMDRLMRDAWGPQWESRSQGWESATAVFPMDIRQSEKEYTIKAVLPGVKADDLDVSIVGETVTIKGSVQQEQNVNEEDWLLKETRSSSFARSVTLPSELQADKVDATLEDGILVLRIPKAEALQPRTIKVKPGK